MVRIGYVINNLPVGGAEILLMNSIRALDKNKYTPYVYTLFNDNIFRGDFQEAGALVREMDFKTNRRFWKVFRLARALANDRIDIVHTHLCDADLYGRFAGHMAGIKAIISTEHSVDPWKTKHDWRRLLRTRLDLHSARFCQTIICVSRAVADYHAVWGIPRDKIRIIYPTKPFRTPTVGLKEMRKNLGIPENDFVVTNVGRLAPPKNQRLLIESAIALCERDPGITFVIVGDGPLRAELVGLVDRSPYRKRILLVGERKDVAEILGASDLFVLPSDYEGFPITVIEAMQNGLPVVATDVGGIPELVDDRTGILIAPGRADLLAAGIWDLYQDPGRRSKMGEAGRRAAIERFDFSVFMEHTTALYDELAVTRHLS